MSATMVPATLDTAGTATAGSVTVGSGIAGSATAGIAGRECTPNRAVDKAERLGLRRARVVDVDRRTIDVMGRRYGDRVVLTFARVPGCPVIR